MKNVTTISTPRDRALQAIDAFLNHPAQLTGFTLQEEVICLMGGADGCLTNTYSHRDACQAMLDFLADKERALSVYHDAAISFLAKAVQFFDIVIHNENLRAEITRDVVELYGDEESDEYYENMVKQYRLKAQLLALEAEQHEINRRDREKKAA